MLNEAIEVNSIENSALPLQKENSYFSSDN